MYTSMRSVENLIGIEFSDKFGKNCHVSNTVFTFKNISIKKKFPFIQSSFTSFIIYYSDCNSVHMFIVNTEMQLIFVC